MELRAGYKQTEVGVIPEDWSSRKLGELATFRTGPFGSALNKSDYTSNGIPIVNPMHILDGEIVPTQSMTITEAAATALSEFRLKAGEVVIGRRGDMGRCAVVRYEHAGWLCGTGSMIVRPSAGLETRFLQRVLSSPVVISDIEDTSVGSTMINLNQATLGGLTIQVPPVAEQRAIATALSDVDALLAKIDQLIAKKRDLKQAAMQQLLTGQTRLPGFSGEWEVKRLGDLLSYEQPTPYLVKSAEYDNGNSVPVLTAGKTFILGYTNETEGVYLSPPVIIFDDFTTASKFVDFTFKAKSSAMKILKAREGCAHIRFAFERMQIIDFQLGDHKRYWISEYSKLPIETPSLVEQTAISSVLSDMDAELAALEARRDKTRALKQGMMQALLTGRIRLVGGD
ncbi:MAG: restriction endonuclease subunit S [Rhodoferax sp.]|nr:restriction endonuclease subunit S [Rhodoferax sp.]